MKTVAAMKTVRTGSTKSHEMQKCAHCESMSVSAVCERWSCRQIAAAAKLRGSIEANHSAWMRHIGVPTRFADVVLDHFPQNIQDRIRSIAWSESLFLYGPTGTMKTSLGFAAAMEWLKSTPPRYVNPDKPFLGIKSAWHRIRSCDMMREVKRCYRSARDDSDSVIKRYETVPLLTIDDIFGGHMESDHDMSMLTSIIDSRFEWCRPTIVTSNLSVDDLHARDPRLASRLGGYVKFRLSGEDKRKK